MERKEVDRLRGEALRLGIRNQNLNRDAKKLSDNILNLNSEIKGIKDTKAKLLNDQKESNKKLSTLQAEIREAETNLIRIIKETDSKLGEVKAFQDRLDEDTRELSIKESRFKKSQQKGKERAVSLNQQQVNIESGAKTNKSDQDKNREYHSILDTRNLDLDKKEKSILDQATINVEETKLLRDLRLQAKGKNDDLDKTLLDRTRINNLLEAKQTTLDTLIEENKTTKEGLDDRKAEQDEKDQDIKSQYEDIERKKQEVEIKRLTLIKIAKDKDLANQIKMLKEE